MTLGMTTSTKSKTKAEKDLVRIYALAEEGTPVRITM